MANVLTITGIFPNGQERKTIVKNPYRDIYTSLNWDPVYTTNDEIELKFFMNGKYIKTSFWFDVDITGKKIGKFISGDGKGISIEAKIIKRIGHYRFSEFSINCHSLPMVQEFIAKIKKIDSIKKEIDNEKEKLEKLYSKIEKVKIDIENKEKEYNDAKVMLNTN